MATNEEPRGYVPATSDAQTIINTARNRDLVIVATGASGVTHSFVHSGVDDLWAVRCELRSGDSRTWVTNPEREATMHNAITRCDPDVRLVEESMSTFGGDA